MEFPAVLPAIAERAARTPDEPALVDDTTTVPWADLAAVISRIGRNLLVAAGGPDERVSVLCENRIPTVVTLLAGLATGVGTVATSKQLTAAELADQWADAGVVAAVTGDASAEAVVEAAGSTGLQVVVAHGRLRPEGTQPWAQWVRPGAPEPSTDPGTRPARPILVYTSGTTGRARGTEVRWVPAEGRTAREYAADLGANPATPPGPHLVVGPLQHNGPLTSLRHLISGQPLVVAGRFDAQECLRLIEKHRVTSTLMVPTHFARLLALTSSVRARYDVSSLELLLHTGSACPAEVKRAMIDWVGPVLTEAYGASEVGTVARITSPEWLEHPGSVGRARAPFEAVIVDESGAPLPVGEVGIMAFRAPPSHHIRYHADPEKTASVYLAPGLFTLGDVGYQDADGYLYITDRVSDMVVSGGVNLYPAESEAVLGRHPAVTEVAVIGIPHPDLGEALHALVVASGPVDPSELEAFCRAEIAAYKTPRSYEFVDELPRNAMGKLDKKLMRRPYWSADRTISG